MTRRLSSATFVGRQAELDRLDAAVRAAAGGRAAVVVVGGEAGVGKSRLVDEAAARARADGARVLIGRCVELGDVGLPFAPLVDALRQLAAGAEPGDLDRLLGPSRRELVRLVPALGVGASAAPARLDDTSTLQAALFEHLLAALGRLAADRPLVLVFEDLHWADGSTLDLVRYLARSLRTERVALLVTYRSDDLHRRHPLMPLLADLDRLETERIMLPAFDAEDVAALVEGILSHPVDRGTAARLLARSDGNAFFIEELVAAGGGAADTRLPDAIGDIVATRVARLGDDAQATLRVAAVVGRRMEHGLLATVSSLAAPALIDALRQVVEEQLLVIVEDGPGTGYEFRHALVQECLAGQLLPAERIALHRRVAELLEVGGGVGHEAEIAHHWYRAHAMPEALRASVRAADAAAAVGAFAEAAAHGGRALELWPAVPDAAVRAGIDHAGLLVQVADATASTGGLPRAMALIDDAVAELVAADDRTRMLEALHRSYWYRWDHGDADVSTATIQQAVGAIDASVGPAIRARVLADLAFAEWDRRCYVAQVRTARKAVRLAVLAGDRLELARARQVLGAGLGELGRVLEGLTSVREAFALMADGPVDARLVAAVALTHVLDIAGLSSQVIELGERELGIAREAGLMGRYGIQLLGNLAGAMWELGDLDGIDAMHRRFGDPQDGSRSAIWLDQSAAEVAIARGDVAAATTLLESRRSATAAMGPTDALWMEYAEAALAMAAGRPLDARRLLDQAVARSRTFPHDLVLRYPLERAIQNEADMAVDARARGDDEALAETRRRGAAAADAFDQLLDAADPSGWSEPIAFFRAQTAAQRTRLDGRADQDAWAATADAAGAIGRRPAVAYARFHEAEAAAAAGDRARAAAAAKEATAVATAVGLTVLAGDVAAFTARARLPAPRPPTGAGALSPRELEVLAGVADGLTNREIGERLFISEKTASVHVTHILDKLNVGSRTEAALAAVRLGLVDGGK